MDKVLEEVLPLLTQLREYALINKVPIIRVDAEKLLRVIVSLKQPTNILEIGTAIGYSGIVMLSECNATLNTIDINEERCTIAKENFIKANLINRVNIFNLDLRESISTLTGKYDLIFLDGPKAQYIEFLPYLLNLLKYKGVLIADNVSFNGLVEKLPEKTNKQYNIAIKMREYLNAVCLNDKLLTTVLPNGDGMAVTVKNY